MSSISKELEHILELFQLSNERSNNLDSYQQLVKVFKMEHLVTQYPPEEMMSLIMDRYAFLMKTHGKEPASLVHIIEKGTVTDAQYKVALCNLCFKPSCYSFKGEAKDIFVCNDHRSILADMHTFFSKES